MTVAELLDLCRGSQKKQELARTLRVSPAMVTRMYKGERKLTSRPVAALLANYPQHKDTILEVFMAQDL